MQPSAVGVVGQLDSVNCTSELFAKVRGTRAVNGGGLAAADLPLGSKSGVDKGNSL